MAPPTPTQLAWRERIEAGLRVAAPFLELAPGYAPRRRVGPGVRA